MRVVYLIFVVFIWVLLVIGGVFFCLCVFEGDVENVYLWLVFKWLMIFMGLQCADVFGNVVVGMVNENVDDYDW